MMQYGAVACEGARVAGGFALAEGDWTREAGFDDDGWDEGSFDGKGKGGRSEGPAWALALTKLSRGDFSFATPRTAIKSS